MPKCFGASVVSLCMRHVREQKRATPPGARLRCCVQCSCPRQSAHRHSIFTVLGVGWEMAESDLLHEFNDFGVTVEPNVLEKCNIFRTLFKYFF